ncbi:hypothetical protein AKJ64_01385 [candidate division MSBL1 archaeon SCGC-AAA259E17]|uniref:Uncharacterized protein n=1 Tax=candidate division MSBL1 archaeon SCGC-AAA259E17 TaxID=1698263 RepID=A0A133UG17_9EURY|nr:hypothetical protein AKJ64_01385 [candidate division MSBL1 archaeon SCGC-AAA259E17]
MASHFHSLLLTPPFLRQGTDRLREGRVLLLTARIFFHPGIQGTVIGRRREAGKATGDGGGDGGYNRFVMKNRTEQLTDNLTHTTGGRTATTLTVRWML